MTHRPVPLRPKADGDPKPELPGGESCNVARLLAALGVEGRVDVLRLLAEGETGQDAIASELGMSRAQVEEHLQALADAGVKPDAGQDDIDAYRLLHHAVRLMETAMRNGPEAASLERDEFNGRNGMAQLVPMAPLACRVCDNSGFVRGVLGELRSALAEAREYHARIQEMSSQVLTAHEAERKRIARELHDDTAQAITSILVRLRLLERSSGDPEVLRNTEELREIASGALDSVRRMAMDLRPAALDDLGLVPALESYAEKYMQRWAIKVSLLVSGVKRRLPGDIELVLYRIVQEALANVGKHSNATQAEISLSRRSNQVELVVEDNGQGFELSGARSTDGSGLGLFGMRERLALVGGELEVSSTRGCGTRITARVPLPIASPTRRAR